MAVDITQYSDRREVPKYNLSNAAWYLGIKTSTLRSWVRGRTYETRHGVKFFEPLINPAMSFGSKQDPVLSFYNLAEAHILSAIRKNKKLGFKKIRTALDFVVKEFPSRHPLIAESFYTDGLNLFIKSLLGTRKRHVLNVSQGGQFALKELLERHLERIDRDSCGMPEKVFPFIEGIARDERVIVMTADVASGQPVIDGHGIQALVVWNRSKDGELAKEIADDYGVEEVEVLAAIGYIDSIEYSNKAA